MLAKFQRFSLVLALFGWVFTTQAEVLVQATPDNGLQPRLSVDSNGDIHLLYFKKRLNTPAAREGNLYYRQYNVEADDLVFQ